MNNKVDKEIEIQFLLAQQIVELKSELKEERKMCNFYIEYSKKLESKLKEAEDGKYCFGCGYPKDPEPYTDANAPRICKNVMCKENELKKQQNNE